MKEGTIAVRVWLREKFPGLPDRLISPDVTTLGRLSEILRTPISLDTLLDRECRKKYAITMVSKYRDSKGAVVCEKDVIAVGNPHRVENYHVLRYGENGEGFSLHRASEVINWNEDTAKNCTRIASYYDNPDAYAHLFNTHWGR